MRLKWTTHTLLLLCSLVCSGVSEESESESRSPRNINELHDHGDGGLSPDDPDFHGIVDFSKAVPGPGGSWCITKTKYVDHMVKDQIKECWHQNVTQCHDTYVTEFLPNQEQKCEESFWKSCKIDFRDMPYNYTMKQCHTPLVKECSPNHGGYEQPKIVCRTWFESECNTTFRETTPNVEDKPNTWCKKVPKKICAPDNCRMVAGVEECHDKMLVSTVQKPTEICDLQPQKHCRLITRLTPHLISKEVCKAIPKEVCHLALSAPKTQRKPITLKWCTRNGEKYDRPPQSLPSYRPVKQNEDVYLPPTRRTPNVRANSPVDFPPPTYTSRPAPNNFQVRSDTQTVDLLELGSSLKTLDASESDTNNERASAPKQEQGQEVNEAVKKAVKHQVRQQAKQQQRPRTQFLPRVSKKPNRGTPEKRFGHQRPQLQEAQVQPSLAKVSEKRLVDVVAAKAKAAKARFERVAAKEERGFNPGLVPASITDDIEGLGHFMLAKK